MSLYTTSYIFTRPRYFDDMQGIFGGVRPEITVPIGNQNAEMVMVADRYSDDNQFIRYKTAIGKTRSGTRMATEIAVPLANAG